MRAEDVVVGGEARGELGGLGAEDGILGVDSEEALGGEAERGGDVCVVAAEVHHLRCEVIKLGLLPQPQPPRRPPLTTPPLPPTADTVLPPTA